MKLLIDYGAEVNAIDLNGNMPLHLNSLGEKGEPSFLDAIELLLFFKAELRYKNKEVN
jgi:ankyrin repeat protein